MKEHKCTIATIPRGAKMITDKDKLIFIAYRICELINSRRGYIAIQARARDAMESQALRRFAPDPKSVGHYEEGDYNLICEKINCSYEEFDDALMLVRYDGGRACADEDRLPRESQGIRFDIPIAYCGSDGNVSGIRAELRND